MVLSLETLLWLPFVLLVVCMVCVVLYFLDHLFGGAYPPGHLIVWEVPMEKYDDWADVIEELDAKATMTRQSEDFIISLMETKPTYLSAKQVAWLKDLKAAHIGE